MQIGLIIVSWTAMRHRIVTSWCVVVLSACACAQRVQGRSGLTVAEREIVSAVLAQEAQHPERPRPILVLTPTDPWLPAKEQTPVRPADVPEDAWAQTFRPIPDELRAANSQPYDLDGVALPPGVHFYPRGTFEKEYASVKRFNKLVKRLGGVEPLVLSVSRPAIAAFYGKPVVALHVQATWSGCGGVDLYSAEQGQNGWTIKLENVMVVW
jgi:hypothetical protein